MTPVLQMVTVGASDGLNGLIAAVAVTAAAALPAVTTIAAACTAAPYQHLLLLLEVSLSLGALWIRK